VEIDWRGNFSAAIHAEIERVVSNQRTLEDVVRWGLAQAPPALVSRVVVQDEFTHDVVVRHPLGWYIVYDTT
jgi:hypothetical protein